jgi:uncharacterized protein (TIGR03000 family)
MLAKRSTGGLALRFPLVLLVLAWADLPARAQIMSKWGHPVISFGWTPYDVIDPGMGNYPGSPGFIPGYGYYPGPGPGTYPWMDGPGTPFDRRKIGPPYLASPPYGAGWTSPVEEGQLPPGAALIIVQVPAEAELWFDEAKTSQGGSYRQFVTPPLPSDRNLTYTIRARWRIQDVELTRVEKVPVLPGGKRTVNFLTVDSWTGRRVEMLPTPRPQP